MALGISAASADFSPIDGSLSVDDLLRTYDRALVQAHEDPDFWARIDFKVRACGLAKRLEARGIDVAARDRAIGQIGVRTFEKGYPYQEGDGDESA